MSKVDAEAEKAQLHTQTALAYISANDPMGARTATIAAIGIMEQMLTNLPERHNCITTVRITLLDLKYASAMIKAEEVDEAISSLNLAFHSMERIRVTIRRNAQKRRVLS